MAREARVAMVGALILYRAARQRGISLKKAIKSKNNPKIVFVVKFYVNTFGM